MAVRSPEVSASCKTTAMGESVRCKDAQSCVFNFTKSATPVITAVDPKQGEPGTIVSIAGTGLAAPASHVSELNHSSVTVRIGGAPCAVITHTASSIQCRAGEAPPGTHNVVVDVPGLGYARSDMGSGSGAGLYKYTHLIQLGSVFPSSGSRLGGQTLTLTGTGFAAFSPAQRGSPLSPPVNVVLVRGVPCAVVAASYRTIVCTTGALGEGAGDGAGGGCRCFRDRRGKRHLCCAAG